MKLEVLRLKGNYYHNMKVIKCGGVLKVFRRPRDTSISYLNYSPCLNCFAFLIKTELWRHNKHCVLKKQGLMKETHNRKLQHESQMLLYSSQDMPVDSTFTDSVLSTMVNDDVSFVVKRDTSIVRYGSFLFSSLGVQKKHYIFQKMRILGRLLLQLRASNDMADNKLRDFLDCDYFDSIVKCTKEICGYDLGTEQTPEFKTPS